MWCGKHLLCRSMQHTHMDNEKNFKSLKDLGLYEEIDDILENIPTNSFVSQLWSREMNGIGADGVIFKRVVNHVLTWYHLLYSNNRPPTTNHKRTFFVEYHVPGLFALSKATDILSFHWCEYELQAIKGIFMMFDNEFNLLKTPKRYMDALGRMHSMSNMEIVIVEASSGALTEDVSHSVGNTIKTIECATASLLNEAMKYKNTSIKTFKKLEVFSIHIIKNKMSLSNTSVNDQYTWNRIDMRSAEIPTDWRSRIYLLKYFELLATLMLLHNNYII
ncbi:hypothetical protein BDC45DRAFT_144259 [Circinella umbellata]|nr:hypothetical protein BDC45DRAFT_144259 [Circinella umbellata]